MSYHNDRDDFLLFGLLGLWMLSEAEAERLEREKEEDERLEQERQENEGLEEQEEDGGVL